MKKLTITLCLAAIFVAPLFAQDPCSQTAKLSGGTNVDLSSGNQKMGNISGTDYHYEIWVNSRPASAKLTLFGANQGGGGAFKAEWNNNDDYLGRVGYNWGTSGAKWNTYSNLCADFNYTRSANGTGGDYSYIGIYGWTQNPVMEWYIIDDWFGSGQLGPNTICYPNGCNSLGSVTVDGGTYNIYTNTRPAGSGCVGCNNQAFPQIFSIRQNMSSGTRKCGTYSITKHFEAWSKISSISSKIGNNLYEAKFLAEAGGGTGSLEMTYLKLSKTGCYGSGGTTTSSNSTGGTSSSSKASSSSAATQATTCPSANLVAYGTVPANPYTACFKYPGTKSEYLNKCYVCKVDNEGDGNTCASDWVWNSVTNVDDNLVLGYWYKEVTCPATSSSSRASSSSVASSSSRASSSSVASSSSRASSSSVASSSSRASSSSVASSSSRASSSSSAGATGSTSSSSGTSASNVSSSSSAENVSSSSEDPTPILGNRVPVTYFSIQPQSDKSLRIEISSPAVVEIFDLKGNKVERFNVSSTQQTVKLSSPSGVYFAKAHGTKSIRFVLK